MSNLSRLEKHYKRFIKNLSRWVPEGVIQVDLVLLHSQGLLALDLLGKDHQPLKRYFQVVETEEKIILLNDDFIVWIVPDRLNGMPITYILIATWEEEEPHLEMVFATAGVYNNSRTVLRVLESFLSEIEENDQIVEAIKTQLEGCP